MISKINKEIYHLHEIISEMNISQEIITYYVEEEWINPLNKDEDHFDHEDFARIELIKELKEELGVNDESIPIILHLIDQICYLKTQIQFLKNKL